MPTETVYGLAADALESTAAAKIFEAKERPRFDPLIVHLPGNSWLERVTSPDAENRELILKLAARFWPGPLTIVLPKREVIPDIVTAGLETVAVRISAHPVFSEIVSAFGKPLAAPSANRFGRISPTTAQHVFNELEGRIPLIIDAGSTTHGIESTIIAVKGGKIEIQRRGPITSEELSSFGEVTIAKQNEHVTAPGQLPSHYAPKTRLVLVDDAAQFTPALNQRVGLLAWRTPKSGVTKFYAIRYLSESQDLREAAANLFRYLRELDQLGADLIVAERVPGQGLGAAILDRLERASHRGNDAPGTLG